MKVVVNRCFGGFGLSPKALLWMYEKGYDGKGFAIPVEKYFGKQNPSRIAQALREWKQFKKSKDQSDLVFLTVFTPCEKFCLSKFDIPRDHKLLIECVETLKEEANGRFAKLEVV